MTFSSRNQLSKVGRPWAAADGRGGAPGETSGPVSGRCQRPFSHISAGITLEPGDIIATGTPSGVALGMKPPVYLEPGDKVSIEIPGIGELANTVAGPR